MCECPVVCLLSAVTLLCSMYQVWRSAGQERNTVASQPASSLLPVLLQRSSMVTFDEQDHSLHDGVEHTDSGYLLTQGTLTH